MNNDAPNRDAPTVLYEVREGVAHVTLNRPEVHNAFNVRMQAELERVWDSVRTDDDIRVVVLTGAGDKAFCTGIDRADIPVDDDFDPFTYQDPGRRIGPKSQGVWKPVIVAINGMACGGAFYLIGESDIAIASANATFFDPHVTYGMAAVFEPILLGGGRLGFSEIVRMSLLGAHERISARTAREIGLVTQVVEPDDLGGEATRLARLIASQPPAAIQATLRTLWAARELTPGQAKDLGNVFLHLGTTSRALTDGQELFEGHRRPEWSIR